jgi:hypothetical protein
VRIKIREDQMPKFTALFVHFLNVFLFLAGPEGLGIKNFKIETQCFYKAK